MKANGKGNCADCRAEYDRCGNKDGIPQNDARDFKRSHPGVVHRCDATGHNGAAHPWPVAPAWGERYRESRAGQQDGRDQRQDGQYDIIAARDSRRERQHCDKVRRPYSDGRMSMSRDSLRLAPGRGSSLSAASRLPSTKRRLVRYTVEPPTPTLPAIASSLAPASAASRICARFSLRAAHLPPLSSAFSSSRSPWLSSTRY